MWQDNINSSFEFFGGLFIMLSIIKLYKDKKVRGVSFIHVGYFAMWGYWNIYYYPHLNQWFSFVGGLIVTLINTFWLGQIIYYLRKERKAVL